MSVWRSVSNTEPPTFPFGFGGVEVVDRHGGVTSGAPRVLHATLRILGSAWKWVERTRVAQTSSRRLRVAETVSLGEKRFVSIVQVDGAQFLIGGSATEIQLLANLNPQPGGMTATFPEEQEPA